MRFERKLGFYEKYIKRLLDIICSLLFIIVFCWLYAIIAMIVRVKMGSPVLFKQPRPGIIKNGKETMKGNVDAELVLHAAAIEFDNYEKAVIVTSDGDFACLVKYLDEKEKIQKIITPTKRHSTLFRPYLKYVLPLKAITQ